MRRTLLSLALLALPACAHKESPPPTPAADDLEGRPVVDNPAAKPGDVTLCPYSGRKFVVKEDSPTLEHDGKTYVFCSQQARDAVAAEPDRYLKPAPEPAAEPAADADADAE